MRTSAQKMLLAALGATLLQACGAPAKSAGEVASLFSGDAVSLEEKVQGVCELLKERTEEPSLADTSLTLNGCDQVGLAAFNLNDIESFQFLGLDDGRDDKANKLIHFDLRAQLWLNKTLFDLAGLLGEKLKNSKESGSDGLGGGLKKGPLKLPDSIGKKGGPIELSVNIDDDPKIDKEAFNFALQVSVKAKGLVDIDNTIKLTAQLFENKIAAHVKTVQDMPFEKSLLKNMEVLLIATPHAGDFYVDAFISCNIHSLGVADDAIKAKALNIVQSMLKTAVNTFLNLRKADSEGST